MPREAGIRLPVEDIDERRPANRVLRQKWWADVVGPVTVPWLIKGVLPSDGVSVVFGAPSCGKSFWSLDVAAHVAFGLPWRGRPVRQGVVIYIAAEAGLGQQNRIWAWKLHHGLEDSAGPFLLIPEAINLLDANADISILESTMRAAATKMEEPIRLVIIDTLNRAFGGGDENSSADMGAVIDNIGRLREASGGHYLIVHHSGKDLSRGTRGHSSLLGAVDTEIEIKDNSGARVARLTKQRDGMTGDTFGFRLESVELARDDDGDAITSCAVVIDDAATTSKPSKIGGQAGVALRLLYDAVNDAGEVPPTCSHIPGHTACVPVSKWRDYCYLGNMTERDTSGTRRKAFSRAITTLQNGGFIGVWDGLVWPVASAGQAGTWQDNA